MRMRRAQDRQMKRAGQFDVVNVAPFPGQEFVILTPPERPADNRASAALLRPLGHPSEGFDPGPQFDLQGSGAARLAQDLDIGLGDRVGIERAVRAVPGSGRRALRTPASITKWATWMPFGPSSRAVLCARPHSANLPIAKAAECGYDRTMLWAFLLRDGRAPE
jgi:hypothetical protein